MANWSSMIVMSKAEIVVHLQKSLGKLAVRELHGAMTSIVTAPLGANMERSLETEQWANAVSRCQDGNKKVTKGNKFSAKTAFNCILCNWACNDRSAFVYEGLEASLPLE